RECRTVRRTCGDYTRVFSCYTRGCGCGLCIRHSLRPLFVEGHRLLKIRADLPRSKPPMRCAQRKIIVSRDAESWRGCSQIPDSASEKRTRAFSQLRKSVLHAATIYLSTWRPASVPIAFLRANAEVESCFAHA